MEPITTAAAISAVVTYLVGKLKNDKSISGFFSDFTKASVNWIRPIFLKEDGSEEKIIQKLIESPESEVKQNAVKVAIASELEDNPDAEKWLQEMVKMIEEKKGMNQSTNITNSKNVVTGTIKAGGSIIIGDNNNALK